jgi:hypothetical protein
MKKFLYSVIAVLLLTTAYQTGKSYAHTTNTTHEVTYTEYLIESGNSPGALKKFVEIDMKDGFIPTGGPIIVNGFYYQALVR